eukprot:5437995-Pyramimonas_sp.AAC.2
MGPPVPVTARVLSTPRRPFHLSMLVGTSGGSQLGSQFGGQFGVNPGIRSAGTANPVFEGGVGSNVEMKMRGVDVDAFAPME